MTRLVRPLLLGCLLSLLFGCRTLSTQSDVKLIGGAEADVGQFPATVQYEMCTGAKIGAHHFLTAAHCVIDKQAGVLRPTLRKGARLTFRSGVRVDAATPLTVTVKTTSIHPLYAARVAELAGTLDADQSHRDVPDVALIEVVEDTAAIPTATIAPQTLRRGTAVIVGGYGCEVQPGGEQSNSPGFGGDELPGAALTDSTNSGLPGARLKWARVAIDSLDAGYYSFRDRMTPLGDLSLKLCPGDSGGPVYLATNTGTPHSTIVAVNSFGDLTQSNVTRIDQQSPFKVGPCLTAALSGQFVPDGTQVLPRLCELAP